MLKPTSLLILPALLPWAAAAQIAPILQTRSIDSAATAADESSASFDASAVSAADFGPFVATEPSNAALPVGSGNIIAQGIGQQDSQITSAQISASGSASLSLDLPPGAGGSASASGGSAFDLTFSLAAPGNVVFEGEVDTSAVVSGGGSLPSLLNNVQLFDVTGSSLLFQTLTSDEAFQFVSLLEAGTYRIIASANAQAAQASAGGRGPVSVSGASAYSLTLTYTPAAVPDSGGFALLMAAGYLGCLALRRTR